MINEEEYKKILEKYVGKTSHPNSCQTVYYACPDPYEIKKEWLTKQSLLRSEI